MVRDVAIHAVRHEDKTDVRVMIRPKLAVRIDASDKAPARIRGIDCFLNGGAIVSVEAGPTFNDEAYFEFALQDAKAGDKLEVRWTDAAGAKGEGRLTLK